jgi:hypothetical protein
VFGTGAGDASSVLYVASGTGAVGRTAKSKLDQIVFPEDYGAVADGETTATDNAAALQKALNTGKTVWLQPGLTYAFGSQLTPPSGGGFVGRGKLLMLTGAGKFDHADYTSPVLTYSGILMEGLGDIKIEARIQMQTNAGIRTCNPIWVRNCTDVHLDVECWGFKEARYGLVEWNSNVGGSVRLNAHDCFIDSNTLPSMQVTALSVDSNRYDPGTGSINSSGLRFDVRAKDIYFGSTAITAYGYQTDAVNLQGDGSNRHIGRVVADNVYEPLDCWCDHNIVDVVAKTCLFGVKLIYGASHNVIRATVDTFQKNALVLSGGLTKSVSRNRCYITATGGGQIGTFGDVAAVAADNNSATYAPDRNYVEVTTQGDNTNLDYGVLVSGSATNNAFVMETDGTAVAQASIAGSAGAGNVVRRSRPSLVRANLSANTSYADLATIICGVETIDRLGEYNPTTGIWTATSSATIRARIKGSLSVNSGVAFGSYIRQNSTDISRKRETNSGPNGVTMMHDHSAIIIVAPGDTIQFRNDGADISTVWFGGTTNTYIEIEEL